MRIFVVALAFATLAEGSLSPASAQAPSAPLRTGDRVFVRAGADSAWSVWLDVDGNGNIYVPRLGAVQLRDVPADSVAAIVRRALASVYRTPDATVTPLRRVTVTGEVRKPGLYFLPLSATLHDAVAEAQGVTEIGNPDRLTVVRDGIETQFYRWMTKREGTQPVASGDVLILARDPWLKRNALSAISSFALLLTTIVAVRR